MDGQYKYASGTVALPPELTGAVEEATAKVAASGGTVDLYVSACEFDTWWAERHQGRRSKSIELTPMIRIGNADRDLFMSLIVHESNTGKVWAHPDMVRRMATWVASGGDADFDTLTFPYSDADLANRSSSGMSKGVG